MMILQKTLARAPLSGWSGKYIDLPVPAIVGNLGYVQHHLIQHVGKPKGSPFGIRNHETCSICYPTYCTGFSSNIYQDGRDANTQICDPIGKTFHENLSIVFRCLAALFLYYVYYVHQVRSRTLLFSHFLPTSRKQSTTTRKTTARCFLMI